MAGVELDRCATVQEMSNQLSSKPDLPQHKLDRLGESWSLPTTSQLHLFCTTWSLLRTIFNPASWWLSPSCDSYAAAFCCRDVGTNLGQIANTASKNTCVTLPVQLQQWHPCEWQHWDGSQGKQNYLCMMASVELDRCATVHEMSNQQ